MSGASNEAQTRALQIDPQLRAAGWKLNDRTQVRLEVPVDGYDAEPWNGVTDYCLYDPSGNVLAVVEAKRCSRNAREADEQLRHYVTEIAKKQPFPSLGFMANGHDIWFWEVGLANPGLVAGFFAPADLERLKFLRQNRRPLEATPINSSIVDRSYQHEAIRRLAEAFAANRRRALLVMATGTGKTRVAMALIDVFLRANQAQNVLFLAERDGLVDQTLTDGFKAHLPHEPRDRVYTHQIDKTKRLFVATEQTLALCYAKFSPGFFDIIIFDEAHRSLFKRFTEVIEYFDARMIGLTATPANFIDRDTFRLFGCDANAPTFLYDYPQAVLDQTDRLRRTRRYALELTDTFLPAAFIELFGDPTTNPLGLPVAELGDFLSFVTSGSRGWAEHYVPEGARFIRSLDMRMNNISDEDAVFVKPPNNAEADRTRVKPADVLLTITGSRIGRVAPVPERLNGAFISRHVAIRSIEGGTTARVPLDVSFARHGRAATKCACAVWPDKTRPEPPDSRDARPCARRLPSAAIFGTGEASSACARGAAGGAAPSRAPLRLAPPLRLQRLIASQLSTIKSQPLAGAPRGE
jgi:hypothetical protein